MKKASWLIALVLPVLASAGQVTGTVLHRERIALPPDAVVVVKLEEIGRMDMDARLVSEVRFVTGGAQSPFSFTLPYTDASVRTGSYGVRAQIWIDGKLRFASEDSVAVKREGQSQTDLLVKAASTPASLQGTKWMLTELGGKPALGTEAFFRLDGAQQSAGGNTGVNVFGGSYTLDGTDLDITPGPQTMIAGTPEMMEQERGFMAALAYCTTFRVQGNTLELIADGVVLARFRAAVGGWP